MTPADLRSRSGSGLHQVLVSHLVGGAGIVAIRLAAAAARNGFRCTAWVPGPGPACDALASEQVATRFYDLSAMHGARARHFFACVSMMPGLLGRRPIVHVHNPLVYRFLVPVLRAVRAKTIVHFQIEPSAEEIDWSLRFPPDHVIACARYIADQIERRIPADRRRPNVTAVPNAVDITRFSPGPREEARRKVGLSTARFVILMMANLAAHKGQITAIRATRRLLDAGIPVECWLAGEDRSSGREFERELHELVTALRMEPHVRFLGFRSDGPELLRAADVLLLPSTHEGLPLTILEAQSAGIPVIASPIPGILEVIQDGQTGFIVAADDPDGYARAAQRIFENNDLRGGIVSAAMHHVSEHYAWATLERRTYDIYRSLVGDGSPAAPGVTSEIMTANAPASGGTARR